MPLMRNAACMHTSLYVLPSDTVRHCTCRCNGKTYFPKTKVNIGSVTPLAMAPSVPKKMSNLSVLSAYLVQKYAFKGHCILSIRGKTLAAAAAFISVDDSQKSHVCMHAYFLTRSLTHSLTYL